MHQEMTESEKLLHQSIAKLKAEIDQDALRLIALKEYIADQKSKLKRLSKALDLKDDAEKKV